MASDIRVKLPLVMSITTAAKSDDATATTASIASATVTGRFNRRIIRASILSASEHLPRIEIQDDILAPFFLVARRQLQRHCLEDGAPRRFGGVEISFLARQIHARLVDALRLRPHRAHGLDAEADAQDKVLSTLGAESEQP